MPDNKEMYFEMVRETEKAINILIAVQQKCEEQYLEADERELIESNQKPALEFEGKENNGE